MSQQVLPWTWLIKWNLVFSFSDLLLLITFLLCKTYCRVTQKSCVKVQWSTDIWLRLWNHSTVWDPMPLFVFCFCFSKCMHLRFSCFPVCMFSSSSCILLMTWMCFLLHVIHHSQHPPRGILLEVNCLGRELDASM